MLIENWAPGLYHLVNGGSASWFEFARKTITRTRIDAAVTPCTSEEFPTLAARPRYSVLDHSKTSRTLGPFSVLCLRGRPRLMNTCVPRVTFIELKNGV